MIIVIARAITMEYLFNFILHTPYQDYGPN